ncbi:MAG: molybdenum cofactor guanylyltransferase MobA [Sulfurospirillaceae bacterium]|nr:molybdenum cofactor guanylyltransferase MobA [Sulfurospirillaceae bacterium]
MIIPLPCIIMAGGKSSRMGSDKSLLPFDGYETLTEYQMNRISGWFQTIYISCKSKEKFDFDALFIEDIPEFKEYSPLVALYSVLKKLHTPVCVLSVDTPFVTREIFLEMYKMLDYETDAVVARVNQKTHQLCAIYSRTLLDKMKENLRKNQHKIQDLFIDSNIKYVDFSDEMTFLNLNHKDEYAQAQHILKRK